MPGIAGRITSQAALEDPQDLARRFRDVAELPGVSQAHGTFVVSRCVLVTTAPGLVPRGLARIGGDVMVLDGEVFNWRDLDRGSNGHADPISSPEEAVLRFLQREGPDAAARLDGNFNLALYESGPHRLTLWTDPFAAKPLYILEEPGALSFGSEKKSVLAGAASLPKVDSLGLLQVFAHRHNLSGRTFLAGLTHVAPGCRIVYEEGRTRVHRYRPLNFHRERTASAAELIEEGCELLRAAVRRRVAIKQRILFSLSGGLDSRAIACALPRDVRPVWARTRGYEDSFEYQCAAEVARRLGFLHYREDPAEIFYSSLVPRIVWRTEASVVFVNCMTIAEHATMKEKGDVLVGGHFGDVASGAHIYPYMFLPGGRPRFLERAFEWYLVYPQAALAKIFTPEFLDAHFPRLQEAFAASFAGIEEATNIEAYQIWDLKERQARMTIGAGPIDSHLFEKPYPFLDPAFMDFCLKLPTRLRFGQTLYQAMIHRLGPEVAHVPYANTGLSLSSSILGNRWNLGRHQATKALKKLLRRVSPGFGRHQRRSAQEGITYGTRADPGFQKLIEDFAQSSDLDSAIFDRGRILETSREHFAARADHSHLLAILATFACAFRFFVGRRPERCPEEAASLGPPSPTATPTKAIR